MKCATLLAVPLLAIAPVAFAIPTITNTTELLPLIGVKGSGGHPFRLDAQVIRPCSMENKYFLAKTDDGHVALVDKVFWPALTLKSGDIITASGTTTLNSSQHNYVSPNCTNIVIRGWKPPPAPGSTTIESVLNGRHQFELVELSGTIRDVYLDEIDKDWLVIVLASGYNAVGLSLHVHDDEPRKAVELIGAEVLVTGVPLPFTTGLRTVFGTNVELLSLDDIRIMRNPPADPFTAPDLEFARHPQAPAVASLGRQRTEGTVIAVWQGDRLVLKTPDGTYVTVRLAEKHAPRHGDFIEVVGLPDTDLYHINLKRALWRRKSGVAEADETPARISARSLLTSNGGQAEANPDFHGKAVLLSGTILGLPSSANNSGIIHLRSESCTLTLDASATPEALEGLTVGSRIEAAGICVVKVESWRPSDPMPRIEGVSVVIRTPSDIRIVAQPPWWTPAKFLIVIGTLLFALLVFLLWIVLLRRSADRKSKELIEEKFKHFESNLKVQERTRIAVELHDALAQNLTGVSLEIDSAEQLSSKDSEGMLRHLRIAARTLQSCRNELRNCLWDLRSRALEEKDMNEAIRRAIAPQISDIELMIRFNVPRKNLTDDIAYALMRIIRELVINAVKHGEATAVKIAGEQEGGLLRFSVRDNGKGFDPDACPGVLQGHFGLQGIRERINRFNGDLKIESRPNAGTRISVSLDIAEKSPTSESRT